MTHCNAGPDRYASPATLEKKKSLAQECADLTSVFQNMSLKDYAQAFRSTVENIFGLGDTNAMPPVNDARQLTAGWNLRAISSIYNIADFEAVRTFLSPKGPLITAAFRITNEPFQQFYFPIAWLPGKVRQEIEGGTPSSFYANKIQSAGPGKVPVNVVLNAFEFYVFHFAHFLNNGNNMGNSYATFTGEGVGFSSMNDSLYPVLVEDLLSTFLPCDSSMPPGPAAAPVSQRGVLSPMPQRSNAYASPGVSNLHLSSFMSPILRSPRPSELHATSMNSPRNYYQAGVAFTSSPLQSNPTSQLNQTHTEVSMWSSQVVLQIFLEKWVNQYVPTPAGDIFNQLHTSPVQQVSQPYNSQWLGSPASSSPSIMQDPHFMEYFPNWKSYSRLQNVSVPSCDQVKIVRMLIKHLHYFANAIKPHQPSSLDPLRRSVWSMCRKSIYLFLKHLFRHWPFDSSFRLVLETWLSYIQPWRYTNFLSDVRSPKNQDTSPDMDQLKCLDEKWFPFLRENLLFYIHLFELLIGRLQRIDLVCPKNAQILFRVTKVYSQNNLLPLIEDIERQVGIGTQRSHASSQSHMSSQTSVENTHTMIQCVRAHINDMEGPRYPYDGIMATTTLEKVTRLVKMIQKAQASISEELATNSSGDRSSELSGLSAIWNYFSSYTQTRDDKVHKDEMSKCLIHLQHSCKYLCNLFEINPPLSVDVNDSFNLSTSFHGPSGALMDRTCVPDQMLTDQGNILSPLGRMQMLCGMKRFDIKYDGNPDLSPICSYELVYLVRFFYDLAQRVNVKYEPQMVEYFYRKDLIGRFVRVFLQEPITVYETVKSVDGMHTRIPKPLPPRLTLRPLANKHLIGLIMACWLIFSMLGISIVGVSLKMFFPLVIVFIVFKMCTEPTNQLEVRIPPGFATPSDKLTQHARG